MDDFLEITTEDIDIIKQLIEISAKNGHISPINFISVGNLYNKLLSVITKIDSSNDD